MRDKNNDIRKLIENNIYDDDLEYPTIGELFYSSAQQQAPIVKSKNNWLSEVYGIIVEKS